MLDVDTPDLTLSDAHALLTALTALHDAVDLPALAAVVPGWTDDLIPHDAMDVIGALPVDADRCGASRLEHRLAIRTEGGGQALVGLLLGRRAVSFSSRDVAVAGLLGPLLGAAVDHVRLRAALREQRAALAVLTHREREVLALVADGRTNRDIADVLFIEARTVEKHLEHIRAKLGARSRADAAASWARAAY